MATRLILDEIKGKMPIRKMGKAALAELQSRLDSLNDSQRSEAFLRIQEANLKSPLLVAILNFFFGNLGIARFMIGDIGIGIGRLVYSLVALGASGVADDEDTKAFAGILMAVMWIWWLIDLFLVEKKLRMQNLRKVLLAIESVKGK